MIDLYYWTTPNGHKITICLEEVELPYQIKPVDITRDEQFEEQFLKISPNHKIPAIIDNEPSDHQGPLSLFESAAILIYLAEETGSFLPKNLRGRFETIQWLNWQVANLGPMAGQNHYFLRYANEKVPHAMDRYQSITEELYEILNKELQVKEYIAGNEYTIADMAIYPWVVSDQTDIINLEHFPAVKTWMETINERKAVIRAYEKAQEINPEA
jgi:GST-like protein